MVKIHPPQGNGSALELKSAYLSPEGSTTNLLVDETPSEGGNAKNPSSKWPEQNPDFATIRVVSKVVLFVLKKCWMICGVSFVTVFVIYWYCSSALALLLLMFSVSGLVYQLGDWLLYHPEQPPHSRLYVPSPSTLGLPCDGVQLKTRDGLQLQGMLVKQSPALFSQAPTLLYFHGNAGNIGHR